MQHADNNSHVAERIQAPQGPFSTSFVLSRRCYIPPLFLFIPFVALFIDIYIFRYEFLSRMEGGKVAMR